MTHYLAYRKFSLSQAPLNIKVLLTLFSAVMTVALVIGVVNFWDKTGLSPAGIAAHYLGNAGQTLAAGQEMTFAMTFRQLLDATHPHLFGQGVLLFILCHIVALTGLSERLKSALYGVGFGAMLLDAGMPWLIRYVSPAMAPLQLVTTFTLFASFAVLLGVTLRETWFVPAPEPEAAKTRETIWPDRPGQSGAGGDARPRRARDGRDKRRGRRDGAAGAGSSRPEGARPDGARRPPRSGDGAPGGSDAAAEGAVVSGEGTAPRERGDGERRPRFRGTRRRGPRRNGDDGGSGESTGAPTAGASVGGTE